MSLTAWYSIERLSLGAILVLSALVAPASGQTATPARLRPVPPAGPESGAPHELPSNQESGVDIDRFIGSPRTAFAKVFNGLMTRSMLRRGDPYAPGPSGAVLEYRDDLALATLEPHFQTRMIEAPGIYFYYVEAGAGRLESEPGAKRYDLHPGVGVLVAPNVRHRFVNTGDEQLRMVMLTWSDNDGLKVARDLKVVDTNETPLGSNRAHWVHAGKPMVNTADGVNITISAILIPPMSYGGPHAHVKGVEEIWVKADPGVGYAILGSEIRRIDGVGAFLSPPNGLTVHSSMNLDEERPQTWLYMSRRLPQPAPPAVTAAPR